MIKEIPVGMGKVTIVDEQDYEWLSTFKWHTSSNYVRTYLSGSRLVGMARLILNAPDWLVVDHVNGDTLDNRKANLRLATTSQNCQNRRPSDKGKHSRFKGVSKFIQTRQLTTGPKTYVYYRAYIAENNVTRHLGTFKTEEDAARAYNEAAIKLYGKFARLNEV